MACTKKKKDDEKPCCDSCASGKTCEGVTDAIVKLAANRAAAPLLAHTRTVRSHAATVVEKTIKGEKHLVFPVVLMTEGVRQAANAANPELILRSVFEKTFTKKGLVVPLVFTHPKKGKEFVGVNEPHDKDSGIPLGFITDLKFVGSKYVGQAHLSLKLAAAAGDQAMIQVERIRRKRVVEVSIGYSARTLPVGGTFAGKPFFGIQFGASTPDHLAILRPQDIGACSVSEGCGGPRAAEAPKPAPLPVSFYGHVLESSKFRQRFILRDKQIISLGEREPSDLRDADGSSFAIIFENVATKKVAVLGQRFSRLSEARTVARDRILRLRNPDLVAIIGQRLGTAEIEGKREAVWRDVVGIRYRKAEKAKS